MLKLVIEVDVPGWAVQGVKEHLAMCLERFGDVRVVDVQNTDAQPLECQMEMDGGP